LEKTILRRIVHDLEGALSEIHKSSSKDERKDAKLRSRYAEYLIALKLAQHGFDVHVKSGFKGPDLVVNGKDRIEVKTGDYNKRGGAFSFGQGTQIADKQFDYCICIGFPEDGSPKAKEILVFAREELREISEPRGKNVARYPSTNPCILIRSYSEEDYLKSMKKTDIRKIELSLIHHVSDYLNRWDKIAQVAGNRGRDEQS